MLSFGLACWPAGHITARRSNGRANLCPRMEAPRGVGAGGAGGNDGHIPFSRLGEFAHSGGDRTVQDSLAQDVLWRIAEVSSETILDEKIQQFGSGMSDLLSSMFLRRERDIIANNESIALQAALADIARWNHAWREGQKTCRERREQISEELAVVNKLLQMQKRKNGRRKKIRLTRTGKASLSNHLAIGRPSEPYLFGQVPKIVVGPFVVGFTTVFMSAFEHIVVARDPSFLAKASFGSLISIAVVIHVKMLREISRGPRSL